MNVKSIIKTIGLVIGIVVLFILPDYLYMTVNPTYHIRWTFLIMKFLIPLSLGLVLCKNKWVSTTVLILLFAIQMMQFAKIDFFGRLLAPADFRALFTEWQDIAIGASNALSAHWMVIFVVFIPFAVIFSTLHNNQGKKTIIGEIIIGGTLIFVILSNWLFRGVPYPLEGRVSIDNSLKSFSLFIVDVFRNYETPKYLPYEIKNVGIPHDEPITIVYIIGESVNAKHMSLFGYERDTTPGLKELAKQDNFYYTEGIAGGICTKSSIKFMGNVIWEPNNPKMTSSCETSLCKLAKENGFKVFYFSTQYDKMLNSICNMSTHYIDIIKTRNSNEKHVEDVSDEYIFELLDQYEKEQSNRNFIILHQWCVHEPYLKYLPKSYNLNKRFTGGTSQIIDDYDSAMIYNDSVLTRIFNRFNKQKEGKFYIFFASDHNECMGEGGVWSHSFLFPQVANVPFCIQSNDPKTLKKVKAIDKLTQYEMTKMIARILGFEIHNPNQKENIFYINGLDYDGRGGYIELTKHPETKTVTYVTHYRKFKNEARK